jgi:adenylate cyclase
MAGKMPALPGLLFRAFSFMKYCPECRRAYADETLNFCLEDGMPLVGDLQPLPSPAVSETPISSIAVLPFANMSAEAENEYFCDGLAEELLNALANVDGLKVAARTSSFSFKGKNIAAGEIGRLLNVGSILEGSVRRAGNRLRITAQLINAADGYHLWSERYDREIKDIFDVQDEITRSIVETLKVKLLGENETIAKRRTDDLEAYELYLKGRFFFNQYTIEAWQKAIRYFEQAIAKEADYAPALAGLALTLSGLAYFDFLNPNEVIPQSRAAAERALELDADLADAHYTLGNIQFHYEWDWEGAEASFRRAIELNSNNAAAHQYYGIFLFARKRFDEAVREGESALALDPLSLMVNLHAGWIYLAAGRLAESFAQVQKIIKLEPRFYGSYWLLGTIRQMERRFAESVEALQKSLALGGSQVVLSTLGLTYALAEKRGEAMKVIDQLLEMKKSQFVAAFNIARVYIGLGEVSKTLEWLEKSFEERNGELVFLDAITGMNSGKLYGGNLRDDPRFLYLLRRIDFKL